MLNMIRMEVFRMFKTKSMYIIWVVMAVCVLFANSLSAEEIQDYSMEEKQEMYEAAMSDEEEEVMFGMYVTLPTKPGEEVSVFDGFYANVKGKFIALFMVIFTVLYATADITSGYVKNIAGQVRNRGNLILAKAVALFCIRFLPCCFLQEFKHSAMLYSMRSWLWDREKNFFNMRCYRLYCILPLLWSLCVLRWYFGIM